MPRQRKDGGVDYPQGVGQGAITLVPLDGRWYLSRRAEESSFRANIKALHVRIPEDISPAERSSRFDEPLTELLLERGLGSVTGGGTLREAGQFQFVGLDVSVNDVASALPLVRQKLREVKAPRGTVIEEIETRTVHPVWYGSTTTADISTRRKVVRTFFTVLDDRVFTVRASRIGGGPE
jgi:hypothetical protein